MTSSHRISASAHAEAARQAIELGLAMDSEARSQTLARLIAATIHGGHRSALQRFAETGELDPEAALSELNHIRVPLEQEAWLDALGRHIVTTGDRS